MTTTLPASSALVIYYFGTRDRLLVDALRYSEESGYEAAEKMLADHRQLYEQTLREAKQSQEKAITDLRSNQ